MRARLRAGVHRWSVQPCASGRHSNGDPAECARRAGQSIEVLFRRYAKFLDGVQEQANRLIEQSMEEWDRVSQGAAPAG
jgi:hypothetical protein